MLKRILIRKITSKVFLYYNFRKGLTLYTLTGIICIVVLINVLLFATRVGLISSPLNDLTHYQIKLDSFALNNLIFLNDKFFSSTAGALENVWLYSAIPDYRVSTNTTFIYRILASHNTSLLEEAISYGIHNLYCHFWLVHKPSLHFTNSYRVILSRAEFFTWKDSGKL